jgi:hypothetical protein
MLDAMAHVIPEDFLFDSPQSRAHSGDLRNDIDAVSVFINHSRQTPHLAFDSVETFFAGRLDVTSHERYIPHEGIKRNPT